VVRQAAPEGREDEPQTIEGHLSYYVQKGLIKIEELVHSDKIKLIEPVLKGFNGGSITPIKEKLGKDISFGEIRLVIAWTLFKSSPTSQ
jgi:ATP-dependent DNA helicase RecQ